MKSEKRLLALSYVNSLIISLWFKLLNKHDVVIMLEADA